MTGVIKMRIVIDYKLDNWNDTIKHNRVNKFEGNREKKREMNIIKLFLLNTPKIEKYPIKINCIWHTTNMGSDLDNKSIKAILDEMQEMGILENDNCKHINEINYKVVRDIKDFLVMEIEDNE